MSMFKAVQCLALTLIIALVATNVKIATFCSTTNCLSSVLGNDDAAAPLHMATMNTAHENNERRTESAHEIIQNAYKRSFSVMAKQCNDTSVRLKSCVMEQVLPLNRTFPWWYRSLLRDMTTGGALEGPWHYLSSNNPHVKLCSIEKVGTQIWRAVFIKLNENSTGNRFQPGPREPKARADSPNYVVFRDPLERLLSGYLNICREQRNRGQAEHCYPTMIFDNRENPDAIRIMDGIQEGPERFARYVDSMALSWNIHFMPQALFCDGLFRTLPKYDRKLIMNNDFYKDIRAVQEEMGGRFQDAVEKSLDVEKHLNETDLFKSLRDVGQHKAHVTAANTKVMQYYTPESIRRALQYYSIDYITLGLEIPGWVDEILNSQ